MVSQRVLRIERFVKRFKVNVVGFVAYPGFVFQLVCQLHHSRYRSGFDETWQGATAVFSQRLATAFNQSLASITVKIMNGVCAQIDNVGVNWLCRCGV
jgi:hypothetical protein